MEQFTEGESTREEIKNKIRQNFDGKIVRKDLTKKIKEGANVPVYVLSSCWVSIAAQTMKRSLIIRICRVSA